VSFESFESLFSTFKDFFFGFEFPWACKKLTKLTKLTPPAAANAQGRITGVKPLSAILAEAQTCC
jgi:hypothetical protein